MSRERGSCPETGRTLLLLAGELAGSDVEDAHKHLDRCEVCRTLRADLSEVEDAYAALGMTALPEVEKQTMLATAVRRGRRRARFGGRFHRPLLAAAASAVLFVAGLATGILITRSQPARESPTALASAGGGVGIDGDPVQRVRFVADLGETPMTGTAVSELVSLLRVEPNPNVRLAITDVLRGADMTREDQAQLVELLSSEPVAALRIEILELAVSLGAPGLDSVLVRVARIDDAATVRRFAGRALTALEGQP